MTNKVHLTQKELHEPLMITLGRIRGRIKNTGDKRLLNLFEKAVKEIDELDLLRDKVDSIIRGKVDTFESAADDYENYLKGVKS